MELSPSNQPGVLIDGPMGGAARHAAVLMEGEASRVERRADVRQHLAQAALLVGDHRLVADGEVAEPDPGMRRSVEPDEEDSK